MLKNPLTYVYIGIGVASLYFGNIVPDLEALNVSKPYINIIEKGLTALLIGVGLAMQHIGLPVPEFPKKSEVK